LIPALTTAQYQALLTNNSVTLFPGEGSVIALEFKNGVGAVGVSAVSAPLSRYDAFYATSSATAWGQTVTDTHGLAWLPGLDVGTVNVTSQTDPQHVVVTNGVKVYDGGVTFIQVIFL
jgi:hypothetical protein